MKEPRMSNKHKLGFAAFLFVLAMLTVPGCASRPKIDRVQTENVYVLPPDELMQCEKPPVKTPEELTQLKQSQNKFVREYVVPMYLKYEECYNNMQRLKAYKQGLRDLDGVLTTEAKADEQ